MKNYLTRRLLTNSLIVAAASAAIVVPATADDTDVFDAVLAGQNKPNILFVLDYSGSMQHDVTDAETNDDDARKITILKNAVSTLLEDNKGTINAGIGSLYNKQSSGVRWPISDLEADANSIDPNIPAGEYTVADVISRQLDRSPAENATATVGGLAEAAAYFRGDPVLHNDHDVNDVWKHRPDVWDNTLDRNGIIGGYDKGNPWSAIPSSYTPSDAYKLVGDGSGYGWCTDTAGETECAGKVTYDCNDYEAITNTWEDNLNSSGGSWDRPARTVCKYEHEHSWTTPTYVSPLTQSCQSNFIVLISDGQPTKLEETETLQTVLTAAGVPAGKVDKCNDLSSTVFSNTTENALDGNCGPEILEYLANNNINPDIEESSVKTYTVGFSLEGDGKKYLEELARAGSGTFHEASKPQELADALNDVLLAILAGSQNFAELSIDIDPSTYSHSDQTYFSLFSPSNKNSWKGNLKGFFVDEDGLVDLNGKVATFDDGAGLKFADTAQSFWSAEPDGNNVDEGGASGLISSLPAGPNNRKMYTYMGGLKNLAASAEAQLSSTNSNIPVPAEALDWLANAPMGDPLHTKPVVLNYDNGSDIEKVVFTMTNQGFLHAFDATLPEEPGTPGTPPVPGDTNGGEELFAFMPEELLTNIVKLHKPIVEDGHVYGLDGGITRWHDDSNNNGVVDNNENVMLVFGMRRGGSSYYALDVSNPTAPEFKWRLSSDDADFDRLAQTWSRPALITVRTGTGPDDTERMLMFGGGFDADTVDGEVTRQPGATGNAVYLVDADKNEVMTISHPEMTYSIPSDLTVLDTNNDGEVDRVYFGDLGGQVWRADFTDVSGGAYSLKKLADLDDGTYQPLFYPPSVSKNREPDSGKNFIAVSIGSGDRTQPLSEMSANKLYMLKDYDVDQGPTTAGVATITTGKLHDATENPIGSTVDATQQAAELELADRDGWYVRLNGGEKALAQVVTYDGKFLATTFEPEEALDSEGNVDPCSFAMVGRLYIMDVLDASPIQMNADGTETSVGLDASKRVTFLNGTTIPSKAVIRFPADSSKVQIFVDKESVATLGKPIKTVFWHAK